MSDQVDNLQQRIATLEKANRELMRDKERKTWLLSQCKVVHFIRDEANDLGNYPVEHHPLVGKCMIDDAYIDQALDKAASAKEPDRCKICGLPFHGLNYSEKCTCGT
jgi:hypothetical protein